ncbi:hypothetical protein, partial [Paraburkholderia phenoliruptrix]
RFSLVPCSGGWSWKPDSLGFHWRTAAFNLQLRLGHCLPESTRDFLARQHARFGGQNIESCDNRSDAAPIKAIVTGGIWDYHHNRLCFFNYFDHLSGNGTVSYKSVFDHLLTKDDLIGNDIVFLTRTKTNNVSDILRWCNELSIPTVYMIDDNWFSVADDWPDQYASMFGKHSDYYNNFIRGIEGADCVLTYNKHLAHDLSLHAKKIVMLKNSVELEFFEDMPRPNNERYVIGYSGSPRYMSAPFEALGQIGRNRHDVDILISGTILPEQEERLRDCNLIRKPHMSYSRYASEIRKTGVDLLLAPLDDSRTSASKCPNKYLEITALGAVGIYSNVDPYTWYIHNDINGVLVDDSDSASQWYAAMTSLLDKKRLAELHAAARADVYENYTVPKVATDFLNMVRSVIAEGKAKC